MLHLLVLASLRTLIRLVQCLVERCGVRVKREVSLLADQLHMLVHERLQIELLLSEHLLLQLLNS